MPVDGGEPRRIGEHELGVAAVAWSPDSHRIAYVARVPEEGRYGTDEDVTPDKEPARRITTRKYRIDGLGYTIDRRTHVFVVDALDEEAEPVQLTRGDYDHDAPAWSPDGSRWRSCPPATPSETRDLASDVFVVDAAGGDARQVTRTTTTCGAPVFTGRRRELLFTGHGEPLDVVGRNTGIFRVPLDGSAAPERCTDAEEHEVADPLAPGANDLLLDEQDRVITVRLHRGAVELCAFPLDGGDPHRLLSGTRQVRGYDRTDAVTVAVVDGHERRGARRDLPDGDERPLTEHGTPSPARSPCVPWSRWRPPPPDGYPVHGWVVKPAGQGPFPVLLTIHGGPFTQYGYALFDEAQVYAGAGYAVVMGNPRGSQGYGEAHGRAIVHDMGNLDADDLMALLETALADEDLDGQRVGVMGGSYGGYMTTWLSGPAALTASAPPSASGRSTPGTASRVQRHRVVLRRPLRRRRPRADRAPGPPAPRRRHPLTDAHHPLPSRTTAARSSRPSGCTSGCCATASRPRCCCSPARGTSSRAPACRAIASSASRRSSTGGPATSPDGVALRGRGGVRHGVAAGCVTGSRRGSVTGSRRGRDRRRGPLPDRCPDRSRRRR
jgi:dipeptidyl aminopeptidase/acylaminoacyl peptidase